jgi:TonB family protein
MVLLNYFFLLVFVFLPDADERDLSLRVQHAVAPAHPGHTPAGGLVVAEIVANATTGAVQTRPLHGEPPFLVSALDALMRWRFSTPPGVVPSRTSITFLFRPPALYSVGMPDTVIRPWMPGEDSPAIPQRVIDPGYPAASLAKGAVILELRVNAAGSVTSVKTVESVAELTEKTETAVKKWTFSPAILSGEAVASTAYVVISFVPPT